MGMAYSPSTDPLVEDVESDFLVDLLVRPADGDLVGVALLGELVAVEHLGEEVRFGGVDEDPVVMTPLVAGQLIDFSSHGSLSSDRRVTLKMRPACDSHAEGPCRGE